MAKAKHDYAALQTEYNYGPWANLKEFSRGKAIPYSTILRNLRHEQKQDAQRLVAEEAARQMVLDQAEDLAKMASRQLNMTQHILAHVGRSLAQFVQSGAVLRVGNMESFDQLSRIAERAIKLQRLIVGEPDSNPGSHTAGLADSSFGLRQIMRRAAELETERRGNGDDPSSKH